MTGPFLCGSTTRQQKNMKRNDFLRSRTETKKHIARFGPRIYNANSNNHVQSMKTI